MKNLLRTRRFVEMQGYHGIDDTNLTKIDWGLRTAPVVCTSIAIAGVLTASANIFWVLTVFAWLGALLPNHPFDVFYNHGLRHVLKGPRLPRNTRQRRFSCLFASAFIIATAWSFANGAILAGQILGGMFIIAALVPVTTGFCIPSFIYSLIFSAESKPSLANLLPRG